ncbi:MAG: hypothetical protein MZV70_19000 [Desulfobacterales bacterium]|nr:hypothetical protein [Desulfobacterales bacterium]
MKLMPFEIGPDPKFLWLGEKHKEALRRSAVRHSGEQGVHRDDRRARDREEHPAERHRRQRSEANVRFAKISDPALSEMDFFNFVADAFEMGKTFQSKAEFLIHLGEFVKDGRRAIQESRCSSSTRPRD